ncbi:MAG: hypothetical protein NW215_06990 [Hyphomicrobiales bacterium]|nr:hypothetical protein [Hyphomicrobiales bacterium]
MASHRRRHRSSPRAPYKFVRVGGAAFLLCGVALAEPTAKSNLVIGNIPPDTRPSTGATDYVVRAGSGFSVRNTAGQAGSAIPLDITVPAGGADGYTFIMVKGLRPDFKLSAGFPTKDAWAVSLKDAPGLSLIAPAGFNGDLTLQVALVKGAGVEPEVRNLSVTVESATGAARGDAVAAIAPGDVTLRAAPVVVDPLGLKESDEEEKTGLVAPPASVPPAEETALLSRASQMLKNADVAAARLLFEHLARRGSARAAFMMGQTYDQEFLNTMFVKGLKGDIEKAKAWYRKSVELGGGEAQARLSAIGGR